MNLINPVLLASVDATISQLRETSALDPLTLHKVSDVWVALKPLLEKSSMRTMDEKAATFGLNMFCSIISEHLQSTPPAITSLKREWEWYLHVRLEGRITYLEERLASYSTASAEKRSMSEISLRRDDGKQIISLFEALLKTYPSDGRLIEKSRQIQAIKQDLQVSVSAFSPVTSSSPEVVSSPLEERPSKQHLEFLSSLLAVKF